MKENEKIEKKNEKVDRLRLFIGLNNGMLFGTKDIFWSNERILFNSVRFSESLTEFLGHLK